MAVHQVGHTGGSGVHRKVGVVVHGLAFQYGLTNPYPLPLRWNRLSDDLRCGRSVVAGAVRVGARECRRQARCDRCVGRRMG